MADLICNSCGHRNEEDANFCSACGQSLDRGSDPATITFNLDADEVAAATSGEPAPVGDLLLVTRGPNIGSQFPLEHVITTAGRHPSSDIFLDDVTVSRRHVEIERTGSGYVVRDVGSLNGTYLNQHRIESDSALSHGDELQVGRFKLLFVSGTGA